MTSPSSFTDGAMALERDDEYDQEDSMGSPAGAMDVDIAKMSPLKVETEKKRGRDEDEENREGDGPSGREDGTGNAGGRGRRRRRRTILEQGRNEYFDDILDTQASPQNTATPSAVEQTQDVRIGPPTVEVSFQNSHSPSHSTISGLSFEVSKFRSQEMSGSLNRSAGMMESGGNSVHADRGEGESEKRISHSDGNPQQDGKKTAEEEKKQPRIEHDR